MMFYVYILYAKKHDQYYIGQTANIKDRLRRHNAGYEKATARYLPWELFWQTTKSSRKEAMTLERKLKNLSRKRLTEFVAKYS